MEPKDILDELGATLHGHNAAKEKLRDLINQSDIDELGKVVLRLLYGLTTELRMSSEGIAELLGTSRDRIKEIQADASIYLGYGTAP